jgi:hypothetical protein
LGCNASKAELIAQMRNALALREVKPKIKRRLLVKEGRQLTGLLLTKLRHPVIPDPIGYAETTLGTAKGFQCFRSTLRPLQLVGRETQKLSLVNQRAGKHRHTPKLGGREI